MEIFDNPTIEKEIISRIKQKFNLQVRSRQGIHLSDLIYCLTKAYWNYKYSKAEISDDNALIFAIGLGLEKVLLEDESNPNRPLSKIVDNISLSSDYLLHIIDALGELKTTRAYYNKDNQPTKGYPMGWIKQMAGYSYAYNQDKYMLAVFQIISAKIIGKEFRFSKDELDKFWNEYIIPRRNILAYAKNNNQIPEPFKYNEPWECNNCSFKLACDAIKNTGAYTPCTEPLPTIPESMTPAWNKEAEIIQADKTTKKAKSALISVENITMTSNE